MHGKGKYTWKDGRYYEGEYFNDKKVEYIFLYALSNIINQFVAWLRHLSLG